MKKALKNNFGGSIKDLMNHITPEMYTKQTIISLFRCLLETVIEGKYSSTVIIKLKNTESFQGLLNRLKYSDLKVYFYSNSQNYSDFNRIELNHPEIENDEFLVIIDEKFSACLLWDETTIEVFELCSGFCSLNPYDSRQIADHLQLIAFNSDLDKDLANIKQDRRRNENFTLVLKKVVSSLESRQRDLICVNKELKELSGKTLQTEKLAAIGQLCSTIAHELRNPLGSVDLYAKIISKNVEKLESQIKDQQIIESLTNAAQCISNASKGLEELLTELIDYSKPMVIEKTSNNLEASLKEIINLLSPVFEEKGVKLSLKCLYKEEISVKFDRIKLNQAVLNIIKNALEVSKKNDTVEISIDYTTNDDTVYIKVKDQGKGVLPENKDKIFTPYFTTKKEGTGLGLAQARKIMEAHDGSLAIVSTDPTGTIFELTLPVQ